MNELSLFSGIGGGLLGTKLLGWRCVGAVEWEKYPCQVLEQRIKDGCYEPFPIWNIDIREFNAKYAEIYTGMVDVITAGFPCQPFSVAGKGKAEGDDRNMWPATKRTIAIVRPAFVLLENVPGLLAKDYIITIFNDLAEIGYEAFPPFKFGADDVGANHRRKRVWILAYARNWGISERTGESGIGGIKENARNRQEAANDISAASESSALADSRCGSAKSLQSKQLSRGIETPNISKGCSDVADTEEQAIRPGLCPDEQAELRQGRSDDGSSKKPWKYDIHSKRLGGKSYKILDTAKPGLEG
jgi:DNA (cytosine-5)-methyltransferase 1